MPAENTDGPVGHAAPPPLSGVRVLELGMFIAGPFAGQQLGDLGADVIKVEHPRGDPMRTWRDFGKGDLWWPSLSRNKRSVTVDMSKREGADIVRRLAEQSDILLENFQPGTMENWDLGPDQLLAANPKLVFVRVSGFGQDGPYAQRPGFGSIGEAMGGVRHTTGWPDRPSTRSGISLGDQVASLFATVGALAALRHAEITGEGQVVDAAIYESVFAIMESTVAEYELAGHTRPRTGPTLPGVAPSNVYPTSDGVEVLIAANSDSIFRRLVGVLDMPELLQDARFETHFSRGEHQGELDKLIADRTSELEAQALLEDLNESDVPATLVYTAAEMIADPHFTARQMITRMHVEGVGAVPMPAPVPRLSRSPGQIRSSGPRLGEHTDDVLTEFADLGPEELATLRGQGVVGE